ncbi:RNA-directed DNA polymerase [Acinetobacter baumannii]|uniref:antiviral reverse transcriptase Drt3a n=1 Tax=Acinetobacter baumannii TaxID=470 RepID=UPI000FEC35F6|nr:antiviral reverse transcriptase Drt3a [Acinetobacter baumannii]QAB41367.1 RNA-directed DNA polymerase [Acinetobacter baumannii]
MEYQTFSRHGLTKVLRKSDFLNVPKSSQEAYRESLINDSISSAQTKFNGSNPSLSSFKLKGNLVFKLDHHAHTIVERKITSNLRRVCQIQAPNRTNIIGNLKLFLREGVPCRVYRLDIKKFYESFSYTHICKEVDSLYKLSPHSKILIKHILIKHQSIGGRGTPRGLPLSSCISELMMKDFDSQIRNNNNTFFYSRYVDDIIIITSGNEDKSDFLKYIKTILPYGLDLNYNKLEISNKINSIGKVSDVSPKKIVIKFEYLGYKIVVSDPYKKSKSNKRVVDVDLATKKTKKYKLRIARAFYDFVKTKDITLLKDRIKYLANNFKVYNIHIEKTKLAGIYHNYPEIQLEAKNLKELDHYLRGLVLSRNGRLGRFLAPLLTGKLKRELLQNSFVKGHSEKRFIHFSALRIAEIKKCWEY